MKWTQRQDDLLRRYPGLDDDAMGERIGTTARSVAERRLVLGIRKNARGYWSDERIAELRRLAGEGDSAGEIAKKLGGVTRSAVLGKLRRLGVTHPDAEARGREGCRVTARLKSRATTSKPPPPTEAARAFQHGSGCITGAGPKPPRDIKTAGPTSQSLNIRMWDRAFTARSCGWATNGDGDAEGFTFCGAKRLSGSPYCSGHHRIAYRPAPPRPPSAVKDGAPRAAKADDGEPTPLDFEQAA